MGLSKPLKHIVSGCLQHQIGIGLWSINVLKVIFTWQQYNMYVFAQKHSHAKQGKMPWCILQHQGTWNSATS